VRYAILHRTTYDYAHDVAVSHHLARLTPRTTARQQVVEHALDIEPGPAQVCSHEDYFGNTVSVFAIERAHRQLTVSARSVVEVKPPDLPLTSIPADWGEVRNLCRRGATPEAVAAAEFQFPSPLIPLGPAFAEYALLEFPAGRPLLEAILAFTKRMFTEFAFDPKATTVATPVGQAFRERRGVCQDFAHVQIACLRSLGLPARYASGYLETLPPPGKPKLAGADASHAWIQVWAGALGWIDADPTNGLLPGERHILAAVGRDYGDVSPLRGVIVGGGGHELKVAVDVLPAKPVTTV